MVKAYINMKDNEILGFNPEELSIFCGEQDDLIPETKPESEYNKGYYRLIDNIPQIVRGYSKEKNICDKKYELNVLKIWYDEKANEWNKTEIINVNNSNKYLYDCYLFRMFAYMILAKSKNDIKNNIDPKYRLKAIKFDTVVTFDTVEDVYKYLEEHQDIVNKFFIEIEILFNNPNYMYSGYCPKINGVYMFYEYNNVKVYLYRAIDKQYFNDKSLKPTYVSSKYNHKIKGIKNIYNME